MAGRSNRPNGQQCCQSCQSEYSDSCIRLWEVLLAFLSGILTMVTFGTPFWSERSISGTTPGITDTYHEGLWQNCHTHDGCTAIPFAETPGYLMATRVFMCLALMAGLSAWIITIIALLQHRARWLLASALCYAIQGFLMLIGLSAYSKQFHVEDKLYKISWSYSVGWIALLLSFVCCVCFVVVAAYRLKYSDSKAEVVGPGRQDQTYAPLAQFESTGTSDEDDDDGVL